MSTRPPQPNVRTQPAGRAWSDRRVEAEIEELKHRVRTWAEERALWYDCGFASFAEYVGADPGDPPECLVLWYDGPLGSTIDGMNPDAPESEFHDIFDEMGFLYESRDNVTGVAYLETDDQERAEAYRQYFHWKWVCSLIKDDCADVHAELFDHFHKRPDDLGRLHWRELEILLFRVFQNQGFRAVLGPGTGDGGADVRLWKGPLGDVHTLVQAKRYRRGNKISLEPVAALRGVMANERATHGIFVTTSSYMPSARKFALASEGALTLATSTEVAEWCKTAGEMVVSDKAALVSRPSVERLLLDLRHRQDARIVHASYGYNMTINAFAMVIKETKYAALLMPLPSLTVSHDGYGQMGLVIPDLTEAALAFHAAPHVVRAKVTKESGRTGYWDGEHYYTPWNGAPCHFNYCD
ncbi:restriction endonuclease [Luteibacter sp. 9135]|uniref:restriction endonuclease n=1 Tax=Luteibacter sp. 9135 TaxID=1500893 RepID=UPI00068EFB22|nr:restriction endonuclease [Luteibacter sp. 9135]